MMREEMRSDEYIYLQQLGLGVKPIFFEYFYTSEMNDAEKKEIDEKVKFAIEYLKNNMERGYREYSNLYDKNYQFIKGKKMGNEATSAYYKFKRSIQKLIDSYSLKELQEILDMDNFNALLAIDELPKRYFFSYFYSLDMPVEEKTEVEDKVKIAIEYEKSLNVSGYQLYCQIYDNNYVRRGISLMNTSEKRQFLKFVERIDSLLIYNTTELQMIYNDINIESRQLQLLSGKGDII